MDRTVRISQDYFIDHQTHLYRNKDLMLKFCKESGVRLVLLKQHLVAVISRFEFAKYHFTAKTIWQYKTSIIK